MMWPSAWIMFTALHKAKQILHACECVDGVTPGNSSTEPSHLQSRRRSAVAFVGGEVCLTRGLLEYYCPLIQDDPCRIRTTGSEYRLKEVVVDLFLTMSIGYCFFPIAPHEHSTEKTLVVLFNSAKYNTVSRFLWKYLIYYKEAKLHMSQILKIHSSISMEHNFHFKSSETNAVLPFTSLPPLPPSLFMMKNGNREHV